MFESRLNLEILDLFFFVPVTMRCLVLLFVVAVCAGAAAAAAGASCAAAEEYFATHNVSADDSDIPGAGTHVNIADGFIIARVRPLDV